MKALTALALALVISPLPDGQGLAAKYPGDVGIENDPAVIFHDDFETATDSASLRTKWDAGVYHDAQIRIATEPGNVNHGSRALEFTVPQQAAELANTCSRNVSPELDCLYLRWYSKFDAGFDQVGSSHNGATISSHYFNGGAATPGVPADGYNKWLVNCENWRGDAAEPKPGLLNAYVYWPEQFSNFGDHFFGSGTVLPNSYARSGVDTFGPDFVSHPDVLPVLDRWYCYEMMVKANTVGQRDGRIAFWVDGVGVADFMNLRLRDTAALTIDRFAIGLHIGGNVIRENKKYYDDVVAATSYIGPIAGTASEGGGSSSSGCTATGGSSPAVLFLVLAFLLRRRS